MDDISLFVLDSKFTITYIVSEFNSFIWTVRYWSAGDFELKVNYTVDVINNIKVGNYLSLGDSDELMVVESVDLVYNPADKTEQTLTYKGRTLYSILDRRIIMNKWGSETKQNAQVMITNLVNNALVSPSDTKRKVSFFRTEINPDLNGSTYQIAAMGDGDNLYEVVEKICRTLGLGVKVVYKEADGTVAFQLYAGRDRSYDQMALPPVIFSSTYENLGPSRFSFNTSEYKTVAYAVGPWVDKEGATSRTEMLVGDLNASGLDRREVFVKGGEDSPDVIYDAAMSELSATNQIETLDSELDSKRQFVYGKDFFIGDIVQVITDFGYDRKARITEFIRCWDENGFNEVPTFEIIEED